MAVVDNTKTGSKSGKAYWRSLEEYAKSPQFQDMLEREFPAGSDIWHDADGVGRRNFLKLMGASFALGGLTSCARQPAEMIVPFVTAPEEMIPGVPLYYATAMTLSGYAVGLVARSNEGRPTHLAGNPNHASSLGGTDVYTQASILNLYDPDRSTAVMRRGLISTWSAASAELTSLMESLRENQGAGLRILTGTVTSPTLGDLLSSLTRDLPSAKWHQWDPAGNDNGRAGSLMAFGDYVETVYRYDLADVVVTLDADFLSLGPGRIRYARDFAGRRRDIDNDADMNRLFAFESTPTLTGAMADHHATMAPSKIELLARSLADAVGVSGVSGGALDESIRPIFDAAVSDLKAHRGAGIVVPGETQPPVVHALAHAINAALGNNGTTVLQLQSAEVEPTDQTASLKQLVDDINDGEVELLVILGGNPVYDTPSDVDFAGAIEKVAHRFHLGAYFDETANLCQWHVPESHFLETWGDGRGHDGSVAIQQPLTQPLYESKSAIEVAGLLAGAGSRGRNLVEGYWQNRLGAENFDNAWKVVLSNGVIENSSLPPANVSLQSNFAGPPPEAVDGIEVIFRPDPTIYDGQFANNGWLQEIPKPLTKLTWDNAILMSYAMAVRDGYEDSKKHPMAEIVFEDGREVRAGVLVVPGHPDNAVTIHLGYGRERAGNVGNGTGSNAYAVQTSAERGFARGANVRKLNTKYKLARTEDHYPIDHLVNEEGRHLVREETLAHFQEHPDFAAHQGHTFPEDMTLLKDWDTWRSADHAWGMTIDLNTCIGCSACIVACVSENNIAVVGKQEIIMGREMHWIRVDRYYKGDIEHPEAVHQPVPCMQCEKAPCEVVCPVAATMHSDEGLNDMVYNRCIGTRYCSNNCPYKVRRFNFFKYSDQDTPSLQLGRNPNVTIRTRGVMEKCTYCVQRINAARIEAKKEDRRIRDGEVIMACQSACPVAAISFGDINDENSEVSRMKASPRNYGLLADLNTRPRTTYLAKVRNPHPDLVTEGAHDGNQH
jgi:MoCo/4Fe-4S cofactor protein with predicted Tat translocation signal